MLLSYHSNDCTPIAEGSLATLNDAVDFEKGAIGDKQVFFHNGKRCLGEKKVLEGLCQFFNQVFGASNREILLVSFSNNATLKPLLTKIAEHNLEESFYQRITGFTDIISLSLNMGWIRCGHQLIFFCFFW